MKRSHNSAQITALVTVFAASVVAFSTIVESTKLQGSSESMTVTMPATSAGQASSMQFYFQYMMQATSSSVSAPTLQMPMPILTAPIQTIPVSMPVPVSAPVLFPAAGGSASTGAGCTDVCNAACPVFDPVACATRSAGTIPPPPVSPACQDPCNSTCPTYDPMNCGGGNVPPAPRPSAPDCPDICNAACPEYNPMFCVPPIIVPPVSTACADPCDTSCPRYNPIDCAHAEAAVNSDAASTAETGDRPFTQGDVPPDPEAFMTLAESVVNMLKQLVMQLYGGR